MRHHPPETRPSAPPRIGVACPHVLFVHDRGPGQFGALGQYLTRKGWPVTFAANRTVAIPGAASLVYGSHRGPSERTHPYAQPFDRAALNAQGFARAAMSAARDGLAPEIVVSHAGPGAGLLAREVFPKARSVAYAEWWYNHPAPDLAWLGETTAQGGLAASEQAMVERTRNAAIALEIASADATICPTAFQARQFPRALHPAITIHHDGIDTDLFAPARATAADAACPAPLHGLAPDTPLVTYATRGMEPHRGFPQFMASIPAIQAAHPEAVIAIAGENKVAYGTDAMRRTDWLEEGLATPGLDRRRVVLLGKLPGASYRWLLRRSDAHVYLTVPFVLSWSMLEAMSTACPLILSATEPVREFAGDEHAILADLRDPAAIAEAVRRTLSDPVAATCRGEAARRTILRRISATQVHAAKAELLRHL